MTGAQTTQVKTIRGIDPQLYQRALEYARKCGKSVGEVINSALSLFLSFANGVVEGVKKKEGSGGEHVVGPNVMEITICAEDLEKIREPIVLENIGRLIIGEDVKMEHLDKIVEFRNIGTIVVKSKDISIVEIMRKAKNVGRITRS